MQYWTIKEKRKMKNSQSFHCVYKRNTNDFQIMLNHKNCDLTDSKQQQRKIKPFRETHRGHHPFIIVHLHKLRGHSIPQTEQDVFFYMRRKRNNDSKITREQIQSASLFSSFVESAKLSRSKLEK